MATNYEELAKGVVENIGGKDNVINAWNCVTRLRFNLKDKNLVNIETIKKIPGVMGAQFSGDQFQVVIGNRVGEAFEEVEKIVGGGSGGGKSTEKEGVVSLVMDTLSGIFTPIIPALAGVGLLKGFTSLAVVMGWLSDKTDTYAILNAIGDSVFFFLPFFLAVSTARKLKTSEYLALAVAGTMMYPTILDAARGLTDKTSFDFFMIKIPAINYSSSVIPIIFAVILLKYVHKFFRKYVPETLTFMFTPLLTLIVTIPITLWILAPLGTNIGEVIASFFTWLYSVAGPLAGALLAGLMPLIIMTGMHYAFVPIAMQNISTLGYDSMVSTSMLVSNAAQGGAAFAVGIRTKNKALKQLAFSAGLSAIFGITEPAMYGINMKVKKPFYIAMGSSAILGGIATFFSVKSFGLAGMLGLFALPLFVNPDASSSIIIAALCYVGSIVVPFILTLVIGFDDVEEDVSSPQEVTKPVDNGEDYVVVSPAEGALVELSKVNDQVFSTGVMGKGIAIDPTVGEVISPVSGEVMVLPDSKHAIGIKADTGEEILIHIGIDTVSLNGKYFGSHVKTGDKIEVGDKLVTFDIDKIKESGFETVTMVIVTNTNDYADVIDTKTDGNIKFGDELLLILKNN
ncbi:beta-glucoside-specific PTS transporter subunit IIABC [Vagococcus sp. JNUCC 83]